MSTFSVEHVYFAPIWGPILLGKVQGGNIRIGMSSRFDEKAMRVKRVSLGFELSIGQPSGKGDFAWLKEVRDGDSAALCVELVGTEGKAGFWKKLFCGDEMKYFKTLKGKQIMFGE